MPSAATTFGGSRHDPGPASLKPETQVRAQTTSHLERAMLLWPRLNRAQIRKVADDPGRIAEIVEARTSQPYDVIVAMLTRQTSTHDSAEDPFAERVARKGKNRLGA